MDGYSLNQDELRTLQLKAHQGDKGAFDRLTEFYRDDLMRHVQCISHSLTPEDAEDILQTAFVKALIKIKNYKPKRPFFPWMRKIARNTAYSHLRKPRRRFDRRAESLDNSDRSGDAPDSTEMSGIDPDQWRTKIVALRGLMKYLFLCGGYPHEQLAFAFAKVIDGGVDRGRHIRADTHKADDKHGATPLGKLARIFPSRWEKLSALPQEEMTRVVAWLEPARLRMELSGQDLLKSNCPASLRSRLVKETCWRDYYRAATKRNNQPLTDWCARVKTKLQHVIVTQRLEPTDDESEQTWTFSFKLGCGARCKLRHLPPCSRSQACAKD